MAFGIIDDFPFDKYPLKKETMQDINQRVKIEQEFDVLLLKEEKYRPISIENIATKFKVPYSHRTIDLIPETPGVQYLENLSNKKLKESLIR